MAKAKFKLYPLTLTMRRFFSKARDTIQIQTSPKDGGILHQKYPPEIFRGIFVHCCGDGSTDFFSHPPIEHEIVQPCQTLNSGEGGLDRNREWDYDRPYGLRPLNQGPTVCKEWSVSVVMR